MSIENLKKSVEMWVWDSAEDAVKMEIIHIDSENKAIDENGSTWNFYEEIKEPTYRPYNETDDLSLLVGKTVKAKIDGGYQSSGMITAINANPLCNGQNIYIATGWVSFEKFTRCYMFLGNTPCGVLNE